MYLSVLWVLFDFLNSIECMLNVWILIVMCVLGEGWLIQVFVCIFSSAYYDSDNRDVMACGKLNSKYLALAVQKILLLLR